MSLLEQNNAPHLDADSRPRDPVRLIWDLNLTAQISSTKKQVYLPNKQTGPTYKHPSQIEILDLSLSWNQTHMEMLQKAGIQYVYRLYAGSGQLGPKHIITVEE